VGAHPLDRPVWSALTGQQAALSQGGPRARRFPADYGPFAAAADASGECQSALAAFEPGAEGLWLVEPEAVDPPAGMLAAASARCSQMTADDVAGCDPAFVPAALTEDDAAQMLALARLTKPGPFASRTHRLGQFIGVKLDGRLVAMAGERMKPDGFTEVSGVCTHPEFRGRGYASALMRIVAGRILERGQTPFLHAYETNSGAIALYKSLGFVYRRSVVLTILRAA
jgi:predicted GNAT family acetyltransferase